MPYRAQFDSAVIECDTPEEAVALADAIMNQPGRPLAPEPCQKCAAAKTSLEIQDSQIESMAQHIDELQAEIEALRAQTQRAPSQPDDHAEAGDEDHDEDDFEDDDDPPTPRGIGSQSIYFRKICELLDNSDPLPAVAIAKQTEASYQSVLYVLKNNWFTKLPDGRWTLTTRAAEFLQAPRHPSLPEPIEDDDEETDEADDDEDDDDTGADDTARARLVRVAWLSMYEGLRGKIAQVLEDTSPLRAWAIGRRVKVDDRLNIYVALSDPRFAKLPGDVYTLAARRAEFEGADTDQPIDTDDVDTDDEERPKSNLGGWRGPIPPELTHEGPPPFAGDLVAAIRNYLDKHGPARYGDIAASLGARLDQMSLALRESGMFHMDPLDHTWRNGAAQVDLA